MQLNRSRRVGIALAIHMALLNGLSSRAPGEVPRPRNTFPCRALEGEAGAQPAELARFYTPPIGPHESNHLLDMWEGNKLAMYVKGAGLTNNHALIINSHAGAIRANRKRQFALYPHSSRLDPGENIPHFTAHEVALFLGRDVSARIHNIILAGCNVEGAFDPRPWRQCFPHATNLVHAPAGEAGYQPMLLQLLFSRSAQIQPLRENTVRNARGDREFLLEKTAGRQSVRFQPYIAELFRPGAKQAYRRQIAGRELLLPQPEVRKMAAGHAPFGTAANPAHGGTAALPDQALRP